VLRCKDDGVQVSETIAAFMARTIVQENAKEFRLDREMTREDSSQLVEKCAKRLVEKDSPSLEMIKMQVAFDTAYIANEDEIESGKATKQKSLRDFQKQIVDVRPRNGNDFESLTALYRQIFKYLMTHSGFGVDATNGDRQVEREVAAALESVFPRIGLKSFVAMSAEDKRSQLQELANIVLGIRLFNKEIGKGGAGLGDVLSDLVTQVSTMVTILKAEVEALSTECLQMSDLLIYVHANKPSEVDAKCLERWKDELSNRRQYLSYCQSLYEDVLLSQQKGDSHRASYREEMDGLKTVVGSKTSVAKEQVYPKFDSLAAMWMLMIDECGVLKAREQTWQILSGFKNSYNSLFDTELANNILARAKRSKGVSLGGTSGQPGAGGGAESIAEPGALGGESSALESMTPPDNTAGTNQEEKSAAAPPVRLSIENTPDFMQLPLEYQGYCPWTLVERQGLLLPGNPALGVVRYRNAFNVFVHEKALLRFMENPEQYSQAVLQIARKHPELIHLLRLQDSFPEASLTNLLGGYASGGGGAMNVSHDGSHPLLSSNQTPKMVDKGTETPLHFVEKHIDPRYDWNEWSMRRKALQLANLRKKKTTGSQTDGSHFRTEAETQVYLPRAAGTQTATSRGTNPPRHFTYLAGLRGQAPVAQNATENPPSAPISYGVRGKQQMAVSQFIKQEEAIDGGAPKDLSKPRVVNFIFEL